MSKIATANLVASEIGRANNNKILLMPKNLVKGMVVVVVNLICIPVNEVRVVSNFKQINDLRIYKVSTAPGFKYGNLYLFPYNIIKGKITNKKIIRIDRLNKKKILEELKWMKFFTPLFTKVKSSKILTNEKKYVAWNDKSIIYSKKEKYTIESYGLDGCSTALLPTGAIAIELIE